MEEQPSELRPVAYYLEQLEHGPLDVGLVRDALAKDYAALDRALVARYDIPPQAQLVIVNSGVLERLEEGSLRSLALVSAITDELFDELLLRCSAAGRLEVLLTLARRQDIGKRHLAALATTLPWSPDPERRHAVDFLSSTLVAHHAADLEVKLVAAARAPRAVFYRLASTTGPMPELDQAMAWSAQRGELNGRVVEVCAARMGFVPTPMMPHGFLERWYPSFLERQLADLELDAEAYSTLKTGWTGSLEELVASVQELA